MNPRYMKQQQESYPGSRGWLNWTRLKTEFLGILFTMRSFLTISSIHDEHLYKYYIYPSVKK